MAEIPCCPDLLTDPICDVVDMRRRLSFPTRVRSENGGAVTVEVILHTRFTRCSGPMALGDLVYSTTLLPGEKVRLATTDRRSRFSFDSETNLAWRSEQISEEQYRMSAFRSFMSDATSTDRITDRASESGSWDPSCSTRTAAFSRRARTATSAPPSGSTTATGSSPKTGGRPGLPARRLQ